MHSCGLFGFTRKMNGYIGLKKIITYLLLYETEMLSHKIVSVSKKAQGTAFNDLITRSDSS